GKGVLQASLDGSREIGFTIVSMSLSLAAVFIPVFFMAGIFGGLLHGVFVVVFFSILVLGVVFLALPPMLFSRVFKPPLGESGQRGPESQQHGRMYNALERMFQRMLDAYEVTLHWSMRHRFAVMVIGFLLLAATAWQFWVIPKGFLPEEDIDEVVGFDEAV